MRSLARRPNASRSLFVAPAALRHLPRLRPYPRLDLRLRRARYDFPPPIASFRILCGDRTHVVTVLLVRQHHARPRTIFTADIMDARGITGILNIIHFHDTIDVPHPRDTKDILI